MFCPCILALTAAVVAAAPPFGSDWIRSDIDTVNLTLADNHTFVRWTRPKKPTVIMTFFPNGTSIARSGDRFRAVFAWRSSGGNKCDPFDWQDGKTCSCGQKLKETCAKGKGTPSCARTSVNCIEGTGDFRIALWDTTTSALTATDRPKDGFCPGAKGDALHTCMDTIGKHFREYHFRTMPHVSTTYYHPKDSEPGGFYARLDGSPEVFCDKRLPGHWGDAESGVFPGFAVPRGQWERMELAIERVNASTYGLHISMGAASYGYNHTWQAGASADMPQSIDAMGIWFPNSRDYEYVDFAASVKGVF